MVKFAHPVDEILILRLHLNHCLGSVVVPIPLECFGGGPSHPPWPRWSSQGPPGRDLYIARSTSARVGTPGQKEGMAERLTIPIPAGVQPHRVNLCGFDPLLEWGNRLADEVADDVDSLQLLIP